MAFLRSLQLPAFLLQACLLAHACGALARQSPAPFLARARQPGTVPHVLLAVPSPAPAAVAVAAPTVAGVQAKAPAAPPAAPVAPVAAAAGCTGTCEQAKQMWKQAEETQNLAIALDKNRTASRIRAEADLLVEDVKLKVRSKALADTKLLEHNVHAYLDSRVQAFSKAVESRHAQVLASEARDFDVLKAHQGKLMDSLVSDIVEHGFAVAQDTVATEAKKAAANFNNNEKVRGALEHVRQAGDEWVKTYHTSADAAQMGFAAWTDAYNGLNGPWNNVTGTFEKANAAAKAARGLGPDTRWATEVVRVAGDVTQAGHTESKKAAADVGLSLSMAKKAAGVVKGNSGSIVKLTNMLDQADRQANQAAVSR